MTEPFVTTAWSKQMQMSLAFTREPAFLKQMREMLAAAGEPGVLKQMREMREMLAAAGEPRVLKQMREMRELLAALARQPDWLKQQTQLRDSLVALGELTATAPTVWLDRVGTAEVLTRAAELVEEGALTPGEAVDDPLLTETFDGDEIGLIAGLPLIYVSSSPALRRKLRLALASLAVATAFYIVALAQHRVQTSAETGIAALLSLWSTYNAFLEAIDEFEADTASAGPEDAD